MTLDEVRLFGRLSAYGLLVGTIYWFASYDVTGTVLLVAFGVATGVGFLALRVRGRRTPSAASPETRPDGPFGDESVRPYPERCPLAVGLGLAVIALAGAFGLCSRWPARCRWCSGRPTGWGGKPGARPPRARDTRVKPPRD
jgi:hypothetical protein